MWKDIKTEASGENGLILADEEYAHACRITLVKCPDRYEITCGVYGAMFHTVYCGENHQEIYDTMKKDLQSFIDKDTTADEEYQFYADLTSRY